MVIFGSMLVWSVLPFWLVLAGAGFNAIVLTGRASTNKSGFTSTEELYKFVFIF